MREASRTLITLYNGLQGGYDGPCNVPAPWGLKLLGAQAQAMRD